MTLRFSDPRSNPECGIYIPLFVFLSVFLLAMLAVVVDIGTVARNRMRLQKAADAGVLAGLAYRLQIGTGADRGEIEDRAQRFVEENLRLDGYPVGSPDLIVAHPTFTGTMPETLTTSVAYKVPLLLLPSVPMQILGAPRGPAWYNVPTSATGIVPRANIVLVLDTSSSMACPVDNPDCACGGPAGGGCDVSPVPGKAKIYELRRAVFSFLAQFRENWDRISLVAFDGVSQTLVPLDRDGNGTADGFALGDFQTALGNDGQPIPTAFRPGGLTNPSDGLLAAYNQVSSTTVQSSSHIAVPLLGNERINVVLFTDGAPTAQTGCYNETTSALAPTPATPGCPGGGKQYIQMELEWVDTHGGRTRSSSPLYSRDGFLGLAKDDRVPQRFIAHNLLAPSCGTVSPDLAQSLAPCLTAHGSVTPLDTTSQQSVPLSDYKKSFYQRTLAAAKFFQRERAVIYAIGFGPADPATDPRTDLYQNAGDDFHRKDGFLLLLANDIKRAQAALRRVDGSYPTMSFSGEWTMPQRLQDRLDGNDFDGDYLPGYVQSADGSQAKLAELFGTIAHKIRVRLTE